MADQLLMRSEHQMWLFICEQLAKLDAVTQTDLATRVTDPPQTAGQRLLCDLRSWGEDRFMQGQEQARDEQEEG